MFGNKDAGDIRGLEEVFRSQEFGRVADAGCGDEVARAAGREDVIFAQEFGPRRTAMRLYDEGDATDPGFSPAGDAPRGAWVDGTETSEQPIIEVEPSGSGAGTDEEPAEAPSTAWWNRHSTRYWTIACLSALAALVAAGVTAGSGEHLPSIAAQGMHRGTRRVSGDHTSRGATTGPTAPGGTLTAAGGSGTSSSGLDGAGTHDSGNAPGGHVSLTGAATFTGAPGAPTAASGGSAGGDGAGGAPVGGSIPVAPVGSTVGSTVSALGASVTTAANQVGSSVPAAAATSGAVGNVVTAVDHAVSAATL